MLRRKTRLMEGEAKDEGASAELSDMRRRGSSDARWDTSQGEEVYSPTKHCGAYRREDDGSGGAGSGSEAEPPSTAPDSRGCQARPRFGSIAERTEAGGGELRRTRPRRRICIRRAGRRTRKSPALHREYRYPNRGRTLSGKPARHKIGLKSNRVRSLGSSRVKGSGGFAAHYKPTAARTFSICAAAAARAFFAPSRKMSSSASESFSSSSRLALNGSNIRWYAARSDFLAWP